MGLRFQPKVGSVLMCNFNGFVVPEIVKIRPVVVIARNRQNRQLVTVVPISTTEPTPIRNYHYELFDNPIPGNEHRRCWVKCDMVVTVSTDRLDRIKTKCWDGRNYIVPVLSDAEMSEIRCGLLHGIGFSYLVK